RPLVPSAGASGRSTCMSKRLKWLGATASPKSRSPRFGVPRYVHAARLVGHRADRALSFPVDPDVVSVDLDALDRAGAIEAWWWTSPARQLSAIVPSSPCNRFAARPRHLEQQQRASAVVRRPRSTTATAQRRRSGLDVVRE